MSAPAAPTWHIRGDRRFASVPFLVAGIVNVTPDSFSDGGSSFSSSDASAKACRLAEEGAHILDIGAESTRPGAEDIGSKEEMRRLMPVLRDILKMRDECGARDLPQGQSPSASTVAFAVSVDTFRAATAQAALEAGADIINDVSGAVFEPDMIRIVAEHKPGCVIGHCPAPPAVMQNNVCSDDVVEVLYRYFSERLEAFLKAGLPEEYICLDPCIGFGKHSGHALAVIAAIPRLSSLGRPLWFGISRKRLIGDYTGYPVGERDMHTQVLTAYLAQKGVYVHRVHDVRAAVATLALTRALEEA